MLGLQQLRVPRRHGHVCRRRQRRHGDVHSHGHAEQHRLHRLANGERVPGDVRDRRALHDNRLRHAGLHANRDGERHERLRARRRHGSHRRVGQRPGELQGRARRRLRSEQRGRDGWHGQLQEPEGPGRHGHVERVPRDQGDGRHHNNGNVRGRRGRGLRRDVRAEQLVGERILHAGLHDGERHGRDRHRVAQQRHGRAGQHRRRPGELPGRARRRLRSEHRRHKHRRHVQEPEGRHGRRRPR